MLQNAYFLAKIGADTAENEQHFAESLPKTSAAVGPQAAAHTPTWAEFIGAVGPDGEGGQSADTCLPPEVRR